MNFDEIRPYYDKEVPKMVKQLLKANQFREIIEEIYPELPYEEFETKAKNIKDIQQFQNEIILPTFKRLMKKSSDAINFKGVENIKKGEPYLFVSTHRDIVLDSALLNYVLNNQGFDTAEIAIGDNLMIIPWVVDLVKLNKSFIVKRNVQKEEKVKASIELSNYINYTILKKKNSIWIAQRSGRSKDGDDRTSQSLIKMFNLGGTMDTAIENIQSLNICPVAISYEYNPCDAMVIPELISKEKGEKYEKAPLEDMQHMAMGIEGYKGKVVVSFGKSINEELEQLKVLKNRKEIFNGIVKAIDNQIHEIYHLMNTNYIAFDLMNNNNDFSAHYTDEQKQKFILYMDSRLKEIGGDQSIIRQTFLKMYANPVINKLALQAK